MEVKKSNKANLKAESRIGFLLGLIFALALLFAAFEYTSTPGKDQTDSDLLDDVAEDLTMTSPAQNKDMVAAAPAPASQAITQNVEKAAIGTNDEDMASATSQLTQGGGESVAQDVEPTNALPQPMAEQDTTVLRTVEKLPEFPGGIVAFMKWLTRNLHYPLDAQQRRIEGKVVVSFIINKDGSIASPKIESSADPRLSREAMRVVRMMPPWKPGMEDGKPCRTLFAIPINFQL